jgi:hypothetical protein
MHIWVRDVEENWIRADLIAGLRLDSFRTSEGPRSVVSAKVLDGDEGSARSVALYRGSCGDKFAATDLASVLGSAAHGDKAALFIYPQTDDNELIWDAIDDPRTDWL